MTETDSITITIPLVKQEVIDALEQAEAQEYETVTTALAAIRTKYAPLAKHNGFVRIAYSYEGNSNYSNERELFHEFVPGERTRAFLAADLFNRTHSDQNRGGCTGFRLYLTERGAWLEIERTGNWTNWQGEGSGWSCGVCFGSSGDGGNIRVLTDKEVADKYNFEDILEDLSKSLKSLAEKLPKRLTEVRKRTEIAAQLLANLK